MITTQNANFSSLISSPLRTIKAKVEHYQSSALVNTFSYNDRLAKFTIDRVGETSKFFGYGICQKLTVNIVDTKREITTIAAGDEMKVFLTLEEDYINPYPTFVVDTIQRDENTNSLTITAYDRLARAASYTTNDVGLSGYYTLDDYAYECARLIGATGILASQNVIDANSFLLEYENGANLEGTEDIRSIFNAIAEATQTIYYMNNEDYIVFKQLDKNADNDLLITENTYFTLTRKGVKILKEICHTTQLGDNVRASLPVEGHVQYIRDNPFLELREDLGNILDAALLRLNGLYINQFECSWRGNYLLEIGDKIGIRGKNGGVFISYVLNDKIEYDGGMRQHTSWTYEEVDNNTTANATTIGEVIKQTYARVDKVKKQIDIVASETSENKDNIATIQMTQNDINLGVSETLEGLSEQVSLAMDKEQVKIEIESRLEDGVGKVETSTGFIFDDEGLKIEKSGSEMSTQITEDGMTVSKDGEIMLTANNQGVDAVNLRATTYLIIGENSRFEDYGSNRTGCFWIGG